jgi:hypothetical protein
MLTFTAIPGYFRPARNLFRRIDESGQRPL